MICRKCGEDRGEDFHPRHRQCKACHENGQRERDKQRPWIRYWIRLKSLYNLTQESFVALWEKQEGRCAVCKAELGKPDVDHCHGCDTVRGFLCHKCNVLCGHLEDRARVIMALEYLDRHQCSK